MKGWETLHETNYTHARQTDGPTRQRRAPHRTAADNNWRNERKILIRSLNSRQREVARIGQRLMTRLKGIRAYARIGPKGAAQGRCAWHVTWDPCTIPVTRAVESEHAQTAAHCDVIERSRVSIRVVLDTIEPEAWYFRRETRSRSSLRRVQPAGGSYHEICVIER